MQTAFEPTDQPSFIARFTALHIDGQWGWNLREGDGKSNLLCACVVRAHTYFTYLLKQWHPNRAYFEYIYTTYLIHFGTHSIIIIITMIWLNAFNRTICLAYRDTFIIEWLAWYIQNWLQCFWVNEWTSEWVEWVSEQNPLIGCVINCYANSGWLVGFHSFKIL